VGAAGLVLLGLTGLLHLLPENNAGLAAAKVVFAAAALGLLPGLLLVAASRAIDRVRLPELAGIGAALSWPAVQVLTFVSILGHVSCDAVLAGYAAVLAAGCLALCCRRRAGRPILVSVGRADVVIGCTILALAGLLYVKGSPFFSSEEQYHASIIRRLAVHPHPATDNFYFVRGVGYTHPFPGTHVFIALVSRLGGIDSLFAYHKLRGYWTAAALLWLYLAGCKLFRSDTLGACCFAAGVAFALNGTFADFSTVYWAQLVPYSHPSDVAMSAYLPALLVLAFSYYQATGRRQGRFYLAACLALLFLLTVVHIRETVQFLVYNGSFVLACLLGHRDRTLLRKGVVLCLAGVVIAAAYGAFHHAAVPHVAGHDRAVKAALLAPLRTGSLRDLLVRPAFGALSSFELLFVHWHPVLLLAGAAVVVAFRREPLVLLMGMSIFVYLLLIRVPALSVLYVCCTYYEMLMTPVRNTGFFHHLIAGAALYLLAVHLARLRPPRLGAALAVAAALLAGAAARWGEKFWASHYDLLLLPALGLYAWAGVLALGRSAWALAPDRPPPRWPVLFASALAAAALCTLQPARSPLALRHTSTAFATFAGVNHLAFTPDELFHAHTPRRTPAYRLDENGDFADYGPVTVPVVNCPPSPGLARWARACLPIDAVLGLNGFNAYGPAVFLPQQFVAWPAVSSFCLTDVRHLFADYYTFFDRAMRRWGTQPFFNDVESAPERLAFVRALGVTHVLLDPVYYSVLKDRLLREPGTYRLAYDDGAWAVFAVARAR
jgi:hypothetical protein